MLNPQVSLGVEEEVFVLEKGRLTPTLQSLDYLRKLFWSNPLKYRNHVASNFSKGQDRAECFMGSIEFATRSHTNVTALINDLIERRKALARAAKGGLVVPVGALFTLASPTNTASTHVHVGVPNSERNRVYENLAYFLPVLCVASANSPFSAGKPFGLSYRMASEGLLGSLRDDREFRFQDIIISKRLGTIEIRAFDPIPQMNRLEKILQAVLAIASTEKQFPFDKDIYNKERIAWTRNGITPYVKKLWEEMQSVMPFDIELLKKPLSLQIGEIAKKNSIEEAYYEMDKIWREPTQTSAILKPYSPMRTITGLAGYYALRLPFIAIKGYKEWYGKA